MAKASSKKSTKKVQRHMPVQRSFQLQDQTSVVAGARYLMGSSELSSINRRLYRQSRVYSMKIDAEIGSQPALQGVDIYVLRDTWDLHGGYKYAMEMYYNAMKEELQAKGAQTRWLDFRVLPDFQSDALRAVVNTPHNVTPTMIDTTAEQGEVAFSQVAAQDGNVRTFSLSSQTTNTSQYGVMAEWLRKDRVQQDPAAASSDLPYDGLNPGMDEANYDVLRTKGTEPPYGLTSSVNLWRRVGTVKQDASGATKLSSGFFDAPLGIVILISSAFTTDNQVFGLHCTFQAGDYKGVKAAPYATPVLTPDMSYEVV